MPLATWPPQNSEIRLRNSAIELTCAGADTDNVPAVSQPCVHQVVLAWSKAGWTIGAGKIDNRAYGIRRITLPALLNDNGDAVHQIR